MGWLRIRTGVVQYNDEWHVIQTQGEKVLVSDEVYPDAAAAEAAASALVAALHDTLDARGFHVFRNAELN